MIEMPETLDLTVREKLRFVSLPGALPRIITGLRLGFGYSWWALVREHLQIVETYLKVHRQAMDFSRDDTDEAPAMDALYQ
jgi:ABC-type anion transport system duplicated permease subunit